MSIRCVVSDLDGTLLSDDHAIADGVLRRIQQYIRDGGLFTIATGRPLKTAEEVMAKFGIDLPVILCNGAVVVWKGKVVERHPLKTEMLSDLVLDALDSGVDVLLFRDAAVETFGTSERIQSYEHKEQVRCQQIEALSPDWRSGTVDKIILLGEMEELQQVWGRWAAGFGEEIAAFQSEPDYLELISSQANKGTGLLRLAACIGVDPKQILAIGNQMNDLPMLQAAGVGCAVANSAAGLKEAADYVCEASYGDGVVEAIERFAWNRQ